MFQFVLQQKDMTFVRYAIIDKQTEDLCGEPQEYSELPKSWHDVSRHELRVKNKPRSCKETCKCIQGTAGGEHVIIRMENIITLDTEHVCIIYSNKHVIYSHLI